MKQTELERVSDLLCESTRYLADREGFSPRQRNDMILNRCSPESLVKQCELYQLRVYTDSSEILGVVAVHGNELAKLYVRPARHRQGIGRALFVYAEEQIKKQHDQMILGAFPSAVPFYKAMGMYMKEWRTIDCGPLEGARQPVMVKIWPDNAMHTGMQDVAPVMADARTGRL